jgi:hypothetical protein
LPPLPSVPTLGARASSPSFSSCTFFAFGCEGKHHAGTHHTSIRRREGADTRAKIASTPTFVCTVVMQPIRFRVLLHYPHPDPPLMRPAPATWRGPKIEHPHCETQPQAAPPLAACSAALPPKMPLAPHARIGRCGGGGIWGGKRQRLRALGFLVADTGCHRGGGAGVLVLIPCGDGAGLLLLVPLNLLVGGAIPCHLRAFGGGGHSSQ